MPEPEWEPQENKPRRARISRLSEASLRTTVCLDLVTTLNNAVRTVQVQTNARYGALAVSDSSWDLQHSSFRIPLRVPSA